jgi:hypothetical protein
VLKEVNRKKMLSEQPLTTNDGILSEPTNLDLLKYFIDARGYKAWQLKRNPITVSS